MSLENYWSQLSYKKFELAVCEDEPVAYCGAIQTCGVFIGCDPDSGKVLAVSANCAEMLKHSPSDLLGTPIDAVFQFANGTNFSLEAALNIARGSSAIVKAHKQDRAILATVFRSKSCIGIDLEFPDEDALKNARISNFETYAVQDLKQLVHSLDAETTVDGICAKASEQIRMITGFDRVMIYRFEENWDGQVIAESCREDLNPYLGLFYPATDIPAQARQLYLETKYRMIVDAKADPVPVLTRQGLARRELDIGSSAFRASSPIHIQYLRNMEVRTSFSIPIKYHGRLWGLVSCHGYGEPTRLSREIRSACELAGQVLSGRIGDFVNERRLRIKNEILTLTQNLLGFVTQGGSAIAAFESVESRLLNITGSAGAYVRIAGESAVFGLVPGPELIAQIVEKLASKPTLAVLASRDAVKDFGIAPDPRAVGLLAVPFSLGFEDVCIWFRPEHVHEVTWGGRPDDAAKKAKGLEPRSSFEAWSETVRGRSREWSEGDQEAAQYMLFTFVQGIFAKAADLSRANTELARATQAKDEFIGMVSHELRTPLGVMIGWIDVLNEYQFRDPEVRQALEILDRNAKLQINLINDLLDVSRIVSGKMRVNPEPDVDICGLMADVTSALMPTAQAKKVKLQAEGCPKMHVSVDSERMRQVLWNLITNAIKFSPKGGEVHVSIERDQSSFALKVKDSGIGLEPAMLDRIFNRFEQVGANGARAGGLGLGLSIVKSIVELHGGQIRAESEGPGKGSTFTVHIPIYALTERDETSLPAAVPLKEIGSKVLDGLTILLAEDQEDSALAIQRLLERQGATVVVRHDGLQAFEVLKTQKFDLLLSDVGMPEWDGYRLIREWREFEADRRSPPMPAVALTAYATSQDRTKALQAGFQSHIPKPIDKNELLAVLGLLKLTQ